MVKFFEEENMEAEFFCSWAIDLCFLNRELTIDGNEKIYNNQDIDFESRK